MIKPKDVLLTPCPALSPRRLIPPPSRADGVVLPTVTMAQIILEVDGIDVYGMGVGDLIPLLLGEPGSQVLLLLLLLPLLPIARRCACPVLRVLQACDA